MITGVVVNHRAPQCGARDLGKAFKSSPVSPRAPSVGGPDLEGSGGGPLELWQRACGSDLRVPTGKSVLLNSLLSSKGDLVTAQLE